MFDRKFTILEGKSSIVDGKFIILGDIKAIFFPCVSLESEHSPVIVARPVQRAQRPDFGPDGQAIDRLPSGHSCQYGAVQ